MKSVRGWLRRTAVAGAAVLVSASTAMAAPAIGIDPVRAAAPSSGTEITARDVAATNDKVAMAYADLVGMWTDGFAGIGARFARPGIARYRSTVRTACGVMTPQNAFYCPNDNTVYYDDVFVTALAKQTARELGTDGDMAAVGVIAHEMGHAVAMQLGHESRVSYENESVADCLAGAFAQHAAQTGALEAGDLDEAFYGMSLAGDPEPQLTGNRRVDRRILTRAALLGHGTREQRMANFDAGYEGGPAACLPEFR